jgi:hypothetical protein
MPVGGWQTSFIMTRNWQQTDSSFLFTRSEKLAGNLKMLRRLGRMARETLNFTPYQLKMQGRPRFFSALRAPKFEFEHTLVPYVPRP